ncbi:gamma-glutamylcyclotransferase family protein [Cyanobium gracile]|uniref:Gamma-glutamylcyclotransferase family protein n=1 Tax=Cyanobium gracile UHCC 0281 TaxID=3110309 RepID=A0ABU5SSR5_9CYAN|nr:gamma-glutamylcyclotransferase family protein [Cyanobium gracile]MEA5441562.1 gamma-glutamylcyclotransferase family protein [Cyanobium gracile UHCC 0281]
MNRNPELVFVYGTLQRGQVNHHWLAACGFEGEGTVGGLVLHDLGPFPMAIPGSGEVHGEVYRLSAEDLVRLDRLEGYPRLYKRLPMPLGDGRWAWVYVGRPRQVRNVPAIAGGRWSGGGTVRSLLTALLLAIAPAGAMDDVLAAAGSGRTSCLAWQKARGQEKVRLGNDLGGANYLTRRHLDASSVLQNPAVPIEPLYLTSDLRHLCNGR